MARGSSHRWWTLSLFIAQLAVSMAASAQGTTQVTGTFGYHDSANDNVTVTFTCTGAPTCVGTFHLVEKAPQCTNLIFETNNFTMTGLNLAQSGPIAGNVTLAKAENTLDRAADGSCMVAPGATDTVLSYTGTWNLAGKVASFTIDGGGHILQGTFTADITAPAPVFPMVVQSSINAQTATASATIQFRPQDVGQSGGVFVFAAAPATRVVGGLEAKAIHVGKARED